ncbi:hypothetical protein ABMA28_000006 [Loxostege sticticalis]|uniref:Peptidase S1 domain-containing protein n=1 Tax=Loxostege sticticalis TaxID=481309 RepID=A0ABD0TQP3_LOXSC
MSPREEVRKESKFTRGEKCLFIHLIVTFALILVLVLVYFGHLLRVPHGAGDALRVTRRSRQHSERVRVSSSGAGGARAALVWVRARRVCGGVLVRARWAAAPAHCVAARNHPDLADSLPAWKISYQLQSDLYFESDIIRGVIHSHFNGEDFSNNIGLFEQADPIFMDEYRLDNTGIGDEVLQRHAHDAAVVGWEPPSGEPIEAPVHPMPSQRCRQHMAPIVDLRTYEFCVHYSTKKNLTIEHGALVLFGSEMKGFVAWGDKNGNLPFVVLDIGFYRTWIENIINLY